MGSEKERERGREVKTIFNSQKRERKRMEEAAYIQTESYSVKWLALGKVKDKIGKTNRK